MVFKYDNSLGKKYDNEIENVKSVTFDISRFTGLTHTIKFKKPVTLKKAIKEAEAFLSKPLTRYWFNKIKKGDTFYLKEWKNYKDDCRGDLLGGAIYLEIANVDEKGNLTLECGS